MILPKVMALSAQLIVLVAAVDRAPQLNVEPVCKGIAEQGGATFRDPAIPEAKKNCIESELAVRDQVIKASRAAIIAHRRKSRVIPGGRLIA